MTTTGDFKITKAAKSKLEGISLKNVPFGKYFTDHMLEVDYENGAWKTPEIKPYQPLSLDPSLALTVAGIRSMVSVTSIDHGFIFVRNSISIQIIVICVQVIKKCVRTQSIICCFVCN